MSRELRKTPAELYHVGESLVGPEELGKEVAIFCFNRAVWTFGSALQQALDEVEPRSKDPKAQKQELEAGRSRVLQRWLPTKVSNDEPPAKPAHMFADPAKR